MHFKSDVKLDQSERFSLDFNWLGNIQYPIGSIRTMGGSLPPLFNARFHSKKIQSNKFISPSNTPKGHSGQPN